LATTATYGASYALKGNVTLSPAAVAAVAATAVNFYASTTSGVLGPLVGTCNVSFAISASTGNCSTTTTALPAGNSVYVTAVYAGGSVYESSTSAPLIVLVNDPTTTTLVSPAATGTYGTAYSLTANVVPTTGLGTVNAGTVTFSSGATTLATCAISGGTCTTSTNILPPGANTVIASYAQAVSGGITYNSSASGGASVTGSSAALVVALNYSSASTVAQGTSVTLTATVTPASVAYGTVNFKVGGATIGTCSAQQTTSGVAQCTTTVLPPGTDSLTAIFTQTTNTADFSSSTANGTASITVNVTPTVSVAPTVTSLPTGGTFYYGASATLNVSGFPATAAGGTVTFADSLGASPGTCILNGSGSCVTAVTSSTLVVGSHSIAASYPGYNGNPAASTSAQTVNVIANPTLVALVSSAPSVYLTSGSFTLTATVTTADSVTVPGGHVTFYDSTTSLGQGTVGAVTPGVASFTVPAGTLTTPGTHYIIASYGGVYSAVGVAQFGASLSHAAQVVVDNAQTISNFYNKSTVYGTPVTLSAVSSSAGDATNGNPVTYSVVSVTPASGSSLTSTGILSGSTLTPNGVGTIVIQANIASNSFYAAATPVSRTITVYPRALTIQASSPNTLVSNVPTPVIAYGTGAQTITPTYSGWSTTPADSATNLTTPPTCTSAYTGAVTNHPGTYTTYCYGAVDPNYIFNYTNGSLIISKATPVYATAPTASAITYGALSTSTLTGGTATGPFGSAIAGHYVWNSPSATPAAGAPSSDHPAVTFNPSDTTDYNALASATTVSITVTKANPTVSWPTAAAIASGTQVAAGTTTSIPALTVAAGTPNANGVNTSNGSFEWTCLVNSTTCPTITMGNTNSVSVTYTPTNSNYNTLTHMVSIVGNKTSPTITLWPTASAINYGQKLISSTLTITQPADDTPGTFAWTAPNTAPAANQGTGVGQGSYGVTFTPSVPANFATATGTVAVVVNQIAPTVSSWPTAAAITYGQTLGALTGGSSSGAFAWTTDTSATLVAGPNDVSVTYTPTNTNYSTATKNVNEYVNQATLTGITFPTASNITAAQVLSASTLSLLTGSGTAPYTATGISASVPGAFAWSCSIGTDTCAALPVGTTSQSVTFTPTGTDSNSHTNSADFFTAADASVNVTVNACGYQDATNSSYAAALNVYNNSNTGTTVASPTLDVTSGAVSAGVDVSAICAVTTTANDGTAITVNYPTITSEGNPSAGAQVGAPADYSAYGTNAAVLAYGQNTTALNGATITIADDGSGNAGSISTSNDYVPGVFASQGGKVAISNTYVSTGLTSGNYAPAFMATGQGTLAITNTSTAGGAGNGPVYGSTSGNHSPVLATGVGGGIVTSTANAYVSIGLESAGIHAAGAKAASPFTGSTVALNGDTVLTSQSSIVEVNGKSTVSVTSTAAPATLTGALGDAHGILLYTDLTPGDAVAGTSTFSMNGGYLTYTCDATVNQAICAPTTPAGYQNALPTLFAAANTTANITLTDVTVTNVTPNASSVNGTLLIAAALPFHTGGSTVTFNANGESLIGDIIVDATSTVTLNLSADSSSVPSALTGTINGNNVSGGQVNLALDATSTWVVTGNSYLKGLTNAVPNNSNITCYNPGQCAVYVNGSSTPLTGVN
jgi:hypothetical protein